MRAAVWVGNTDVNLNTAANWSGGTLPTLAADSFTFNVAGTAGATLNNDITGQVLNSAGMVFNSAASGYILNGNALTVGVTTNSIFTNYSSNLQTINLGLNLAVDLTFSGGSGFTVGAIGQSTTAAAHTIYNGLASGTLTIAGTMSLSDASARIWTFGGTSSSSTVITGVIQNGGAGAGAIIVYATNAAGGVTLSGANTYTGATTVSFGTLKLDFSAAAFTDNIINNVANTSALTLGGGTLNITGKSSATNTQRFASTTFATNKSSALRITQNGAAGVSVTLGGLTRNAGSTVDFTLATTGSITTTSTTARVGTNNILASSANVAYATVGGTTWATNTTGTIGALANASYQTAFTSSTGDTDITTSLSPAAFTTNTLRFNTASRVLALNSSGNSTVTSGGILVTAAGAGSSIASGGAGAGLISGSGKDLVIVNNTTGASGFTISAPIIDNATSALTIAGTGITTLTGTNTYAGVTTISGGVLDVGTLTGLVSPSLGAGGIVFSGGGVLQGNGSFTRDFSGATSAGNGLITGLEGGFAAKGGTLTVNFGGAGASVTLSIAASGYRFGNNFVFGSATADSPVIVVNPISLNGTLNSLGRTFTVNSGVGGDYAELQGVISSGAGVLIKAGTGLLVLSNANTYTGATNVTAGVLRLNNATALPGGIGTTGGTSALVINGGIVQLTAASGDFFRPISTGSLAGSTEVGWADNAVGGFAAFGGDRTVNFGGAAAQAMWSPTGGRFGNGLILSHSTSDSTINVVNPIALNAGVRTVTVNDGTPSVDGILSGILSGTGSSLIKNGAGTLALTASDTFGSALTTGTTFATISAGTLQLGTGGTTGSLTSTGTGDIQNDATLAINRSNALTLQYVIKGSGALNQIGAGTTTLTAANTYTGATTISSGALQLGSGSTTGSLSPSSTITNNATLIFNRSNTLVQGTDFAAGITGNGAVTQAGTGTTALSGTNAYTGTTTVSAGMLRLDSANALPGGVASAGGTSALLFNGGIIGLTVASGDFTRSIVGLTPGATQVGWTSGGLGGFAAFGGNRTVNFGGSGTPSTITWSSTNGILGGGLILSDSTADSTVTIANPIALSNANSSRNVTVNDGSASVDAIFSGVLSSTTTRLIKSGAGTLALTATNTYGSTLGAGTVGTTISAGTLQIGNGSTTGSIGAGSDIDNNATLAFNRSNALPVTNIITGVGTVRQIGVGTTILSGINTYTGPTQVTAGTLEISAGINASTSVSMTGGTLLLSASNVIKDDATVTLGGGTMKASGSFSESSVTAAGLGALILGDNSASTLDFGGGDSIWWFSSFSALTGTLNIANWGGNATAGGGADQLRFTTDPTSLLGQISFTGYAGVTDIFFDNGGNSYYEIVPIPEPSSSALLGAIGLLGLIGYRERERLGATWKRRCGKA